MNNSRFAATEVAQCGACGGAAACPATRRLDSVLGRLLAQLIAAPMRLHGYRNLNTRLVRDAFCIRDCGSGAND